MPTSVPPPHQGATSLHNGRPTLEEVALRAGVSRATVSRVINRAKSVDPRLVEIVNKAVVELNYVPNQAARALMTRRSDTVALIAAEPHTKVFGDPFFSAIVRGVNQELSRAGVQMVLSMAQGAEDMDRVETYLQAGHVDGALLISEHNDLDVIPHIARAGVPLVVGGRPLRLNDQVSYVDHDNHHGAVLATRRLLAIGRQHIATITGPQDMSAGVDRWTGFRDALGDHLDLDLVEEGDFTTNQARAATTRLLTRRPDVDALFVGSDLMALGSLAALRELGRRVPADVAVIGFDDADIAAVAAPPLTTIRQRTADQGRLMAQLLLRSLGRGVTDPMPELTEAGHGPDPGSPRGYVLDVELVVRDSA